MDGPLWFATIAGLVLGGGILGIWGLLLVSRQVPEIQNQDRAIYFHIAAEILTGFIVITGAVAAIATAASSWSVGLLAIGLGAVLYSTINSPGYYANQKKWHFVGLFAALGTVAIVSLAAILVAI